MENKTGSPRPKRTFAQKYSIKNKPVSGAVDRFIRSGVQLPQNKVIKVGAAFDHLNMSGRTPDAVKYLEEGRKEKKACLERRADDIARLFDRAPLRPCRHHSNTVYMDDIEIMDEDDKDVTLYYCAEGEFTKVYVRWDVLHKKMRENKRAWPPGNWDYQPECLDRVVFNLRLGHEECPDEDHTYVNFEHAYLKNREPEVHAKNYARPICICEKGKHGRQDVTMVPGLCYLRFFVAGVRLSVATKLGLYPTPEKVLEEVGPGIRKDVAKSLKRMTHRKKINGVMVERVGGVSEESETTFQSLPEGTPEELLNAYLNLLDEQSFETTATETAEDVQSIMTPAVIETKPEEFTVGGDNDCWSKFIAKPNTTRSYHATRVPDAEKARQSREAEMIGKEPISLNQMYQLIWDPSRLIGCPRIHPKKIQEKMPQYIKQWWILFEATGPTKLHVVEASREELPGYMNLWDVQDQIQKGTFHWNFTKLDESCCVCDELEIGSSKEIIESAVHVLGTDLAKTKAQQQLEADYNSIPKIPYRMTPSRLKAFEKYVGHPVLSLQQISSGSDHLFLQSARHLIREDLKRLHPHNQSNQATLHVGSTVHELKSWYSYAAHDFSLPLKEDKDKARLYEELASWCYLRIKEAALPELSKCDRKTIKARFPNMEAMIKLATAGDRTRIFVGDRPARKYPMVFFEDCLYKMDLAEFGRIWKEHDTQIGYAVVFIPDILITNDVEDSEMYRVDRYLPYMPQLEEFVENVWPSSLAFTPFIPVSVLNEAVYKVWKFLYEKGNGLIHAIWESWKTDKFPLQLILGNLFDVLKLGPIIKQVMDQYLPALFDTYSRISISWKNGYANGYDERYKTWKQWLKPRHVFDGFCVDMEVASRHGEMYLLKFYRSTGADNIVSSIDLPANREVVWVADIESAYQMIIGLQDVEYFPVNKQDWFKLLNWCLDQPPESLNFATVSTTLNRIRGGLSLGSRRLVEEMSIADERVSKVALAALMEAYNRHQILEAIQTDESLAFARQCKGDGFLKTLAKFGLGLATGGLSIPALWLFNWLMSQEKTVEFVRYPKPIKVNRVFGTGKKFTPATLVEDVEMVLPVSTPKLVASGCFICDMYQQGYFSRDGVPEHGQFPQPTSHGDESHHFEIDADVMTRLLQNIRDAETHHGTSKIVEVIKSLKHWTDHNLGGVSGSFKLDYLKGGPGTGKSEMIKAIAHKYELDGAKVVITVPFNELQKDYMACEVMGVPGRHTFNVKTFWYTPQDGTADVLIVDEISCVDWSLTLLMAKFLGVKRVIVAGDNQQAGIRPEAGEGTSIFDHVNGGMNDVRTHELVYNYRMDEWRTKWCNKVYGYNMICKRTDNLPPTIVSNAEYRELQFEAKTHRNMVFSHIMAEEVYGVVSSRDGTNLSVRSSQGKTCETATVVVGDRDLEMIRIGGLLNVANTRSKKQVYYVVADRDSEVARELARLLWIDSEERIEHISTMPRAVIGEEAETLLDPKQKDMTVELKKCRDRGWLWEDDERIECIVEDDTESGVEQLVELPEDNWVMNQFHTCLVDKPLAEHPEIKPELVKLLQTMYLDDDLMGRKGLIGQLCSYIGSGAKALPEHDGKRDLPVKIILDFLSRHSIPVVIVDANGSVLYRNEATYLIDNPYVYKYNHRHVEIVNPPKVQVRYNDSILLQSPYTRLPNRQMVCDLKKEKDVYIYLRGQGEVTQMELDRYDEFMRNLSPEVMVVDVTKPTTVRDNRKWTVPEFAGSSYYKPIPEVDLPAEALEEIAYRAPYRSAFMRDPSPKETNDPINKAKLRFGTNAYLHRDLIDPSGAYQQQRLNFSDTFSGVEEDLNLEVNVEGMIHGKTDAGFLRTLKRRRWKQLNPGMANHFEDHPVENIKAARRYAVSNRRKKQLTAESKAWVDKIVDHAFRDKWKRDYQLGNEEANYIIHGARQAAKQRNYWKRGLAARKKWSGHTLIFSGKSQVKPIKNDKLNLSKTGQGLMQSPPDFNHEWIGWSRLVNFVMKDRAKDHFFLDDREPESLFRTRLTEAIRSLPEGASTAILDAKEFDSQQGPVTVYAERKFMEKLGFTVHDIAEFQELRKPAKFICPGQFKGKHAGEKGSGLLDTKSMNTALETIVSDQMFIGKGPKVEAAKGDDYLRVQVGLKVNDTHKTRVRDYMGMTFETEISQKGGEFIGCSVSREGMYPSVTRTAMKVIANHIRDEKHLCEYQKSLRNSIREWKATGIHEIVNYSAFAEGKSVNYVEACFAFVESFSHITWEQYQRIARNCFTQGFTLPDQKSAFVMW
uniref:Replicase n=1 Tax=Agaricus bisporus virus 8 TaxID=1945752 RepID=A0A1Q1N6J3_9VIRU|nr:replicase [Agaricus bisporus virus 8]